MLQFESDRNSVDAGFMDEVRPKITSEILFRTFGVWSMPNVADNRPQVMGAAVDATT